MANICILGGGGFVGRYLASELARAGHHITIPTRRRQRIKDLLVLPTVDLLEADIHDPASLETMFNGRDAVINLVGILHGTRSAFERAHVELPDKILAACLATGVRRYLHMSALGANVDSKSVYQQTKGVGEQHVLAAANALDVTVFRPSVIYGPGDSFLRLFAKLLKRAPVFPLADAHARFQPVHVTDVAHAFALAIEDPATYGQAYKLCGPQVYSLLELMRLVAHTLGLRRMIIPLGSGPSGLFARLMELKPGRKLMTLDNHYAMEVDNICLEGFPARFGEPAALETHLNYLLDGGRKGHYHRFRGTARR